MSDELDPQLLRHFADANIPLADDGLQARVMTCIERPHGWRAIAQVTGSTLRAIGTGLVAGASAPFRQRMSFARLIVIGLGAVASCLALLAA